MIISLKDAEFFKNLKDSLKYVYIKDINGFKKDAAEGFRKDYVTKKATA